MSDKDKLGEQPVGTPALHFSSKDIPAPLRREAVASLYGGFVGSSMDFLDDAPVVFDLLMRPLGAASISCIRYGIPVALHTAAQPEQLYLGFAVNNAGGDTHKTRKEELQIHTGDVNVMRTELASTSVIHAVPGVPGECLTIGIPRERIAARLSSSDNLFRTHHMRQPIARLLHGYAMALLDAGSGLTPFDEVVCAEHLADLAVLMLGPRRDEGEQASQRGARAARRAAIESDIHKSLTRPELSLDWIAARHGVSPSYIRALFADQGASFTDYVLGARLTHARALLRAPHLARQNIASLALMAGFGDISWFNKAFRRRFGMTPSEWRNQRELV